MAYLSSKTFNLNSPGSVTSRCKLYGVQYSGNTYDSTSFESYSTTLEWDKMYIDFKNGSASGDTLFSFTCPIGWRYGAPQNAPSMMFGSNYILFPDGLYIVTVDNNSPTADPADGLYGASQGMTIFYET